MHWLSRPNGGVTGPDVDPDVLGGYLAARLATDRPVSHAMMLGAIGFVLSAIGTFATAGQSAAYGPIWYSLLVTATALPCSFAGAKVYTSGA